MLLSPVLMAVALALAASSALAETRPDNSKTNQRIENNQEMNAQDQGGSKSDMELTRLIRSNVMKAKNLSVDAKNTKIISRNGIVVLKGPVKSAEEKAAIGKIAVDAAGAQNVKNHLEIE